MKKLNLSDILVVPLRSIVETIREQWLKVLQRTHHDYRLHAVSQMLTQVYKGEVRLMVNGKGLGKPFLVNTDARQKETYKHSKNYFDGILTTINGQLTKLKLIITGCNEIKLKQRDWDRILKDIRLAAEEASVRFTLNNQRGLTDALNLFY